MRYSYLGESGLVVSKLAFGAMTFAAEGAPPFAKVDGKTAERLVAEAIEKGVNLFDTADVYSNLQNETILGGVLGARRKDVVICTKVGSRSGAGITERGLSARYIHMSIEGSLRRLNTDWIDLYLCHTPDSVTPIEETLMALDQVVRAGKVRYIGCSNWPGWMLAKAVQIQKERGLTRFVAAQVHYNLLGREVEHEILPAALDAGVGLMCYSPLASGKLSGKYTSADPSGGGGRLSQIKLLTQFSDETADRVVAALRELSKKHDAPISALALAWLMEQSGVATIIMGTNTDAQLAQNLAAASVRLSPEEIAALSALSKPADIYPTAFVKNLGDGHVDPRDRLKEPTKPSTGRWAPKPASS